MIGTSTSSASEIARCVASRSTGIGREVAVETRRGLAGALQPVGEEADRVVVLGVHHDERAGLARDAHHVEHLQVGERHALVGHEHLERRVAVLDQRRQFLAEHAVGRVRDDEMERDIDVAIAVGLGVILLHHLAQRLALLLHGEGQHHRVAAERRRARAGLEIVRHHDAGAGRLRKMHVAVDAAGQHQLAGRVDDLGRVAKIGAERRDDAALDADIAGERVGCGRDRPAADDRVECHSLPRFNRPILAESGRNTSRQNFRLAIAR